MQNPLPLTQDFLTFVKNHANDDTARLRLKLHGVSLDFDLDFALTQIECRRKTASKLHSFLRKEEFLFPSRVAAEQASHEAVAIYHASLIKEGSSLLDMTAGLGIDVMTMAKRCERIIACEIDELKAEILRHNAVVMGCGPISVIEGDSVRFLEDTESLFDYIFIDPARRGEGNTRTYNFHDCQPDIISFQNDMLKKCRTLIIKASPLLDITQTLKDICNVRTIRAVCVNGECKEVLIEASATEKNQEEILKEAVDLSTDGSIISTFSYRGDGSPMSVKYAMEEDIQTGHYLYEPNAALMKLAPWPELCERYEGLKKLAPSSHLFVASGYFEDFPGRVLEIERLIEKKDRKTLKGLPVNVAVRNYPESAVELRKKLGVKEGIDTFIYGSRLERPVLILARRVRSGIRQ